MSFTGPDFLSLIFPDSEPVQLRQTVSEQGGLGDAIGQVADALGAGGAPEISDTVISLDVTTNESYVFDNIITSSPVEKGADINDHVIPAQDTFTISGNVTDTYMNIGPLGAIVSAIEGAVNMFSGEEPRSVQAYNALKKLRNSGTLFTLVTGLDSINNCVLQNFTTNRTPDDDGSLPVTLTIKVLNIAEACVGFGGASSFGGSLDGNGSAAQKGQKPPGALPGAPGGAPNPAAAVDPSTSGLMEFGEVVNGALGG